MAAVKSRKDMPIRGSCEAAQPHRPLARLLRHAVLRHAGLRHAVISALAAAQRGVRRVVIFACHLSMQVL